MTYEDVVKWYIRGLKDSKATYRTLISEDKTSEYGADCWMLSDKNGYHVASVGPVRNHPEETFVWLVELPEGQDNYFHYGEDNMLIFSLEQQKTTPSQLGPGVDVPRWWDAD